MPSKQSRWSDEEDAALKRLREVEKWSFDDIVSRLPGAPRTVSAAQNRYYPIGRPFSSIVNSAPWTQPDRDRLLHAGNLRQQEGRPWEDVRKQFPGRTLQQVQEMYYQLVNGAEHGHSVSPNVHVGPQEYAGQADRQQAAAGLLALQHEVVHGNGSQGGNAVSNHSAQGPTEQAPGTQDHPNS